MRHRDGELGRMGQEPQRKKHEETIDYIQHMLGQLRAMAKSEQCEMLAYLIEMAYVEAGDLLSGAHPVKGLELSHQKGNGTS